MKYRLIKEEEYAVVTDIHMKAFKGFFLTTLGQSFLKTYYKASLRNNQSIAIGAVDDQDNLVGFSIGNTLSKGYHKRLIKSNFFIFLLQGISVLFRHPRALVRLAFNLDKTTDTMDDGNYAELLSIAVLPDIKSSGIGKRMIEMFEEEVIKRGCNKLVLTTDYYNNEYVYSFYIKTGYKIFYEFTTYPNRKMYKLVKELK